MAGDLCPYCGTLLTTSLKFCVNCRRSVTEDKIRQAGHSGRSAADELDDEEGGKKFRLSRKTSYDGVRQVRTVFTTISTLLGIFFVYYFTMKFVIHQPVPFEEQLNSMVSGVQNNNMIPQQSGQPVPQPSGQSSEQQPPAGGPSYAQPDPNQQAPAH